MSDALKTAINELIAQISAKEAELAPLKIAVNTLCHQTGQPEYYDTIGASNSSTAATERVNWRIDQFTGKGLATSVVEILETNKSRGLDGPATIEEIFKALSDGGYKFQGTSGSDENTKRAIKIALTKNTAQFVKIKDDVFGLKKWYGGSINSSKRTKSTAPKSPLESSAMNVEDDDETPVPLDTSDESNHIKNNEHYENITT
jgi:hypothetical protein